MSKPRVHTKQELQQFRKELRHRLTPAEAYLWTYLKAKKYFGKRFTKQHSVGPYIVDFYCASEKLIIELDGEVHNNPIAQTKDAIRTQYLEELGYTLIRFENKMVFENLTSVLQTIKDNFRT